MDIQAYFKELFGEKPGLEKVEFTTEQLIMDMDARFNGTHSAMAIAQLLKNGFEVAGKGYVFHRDDFIAVPAKHKTIQPDQEAEQL